MSVLVVAQSSSEIPEGLMNNPVHFNIVVPAVVDVAAALLLLLLFLLLLLSMVLFLLLSSFITITAAVYALSVPGCNWLFRYCQTHQEIKRMSSFLTTIIITIIIIIIISGRSSNFHVRHEI